MKYILVVIVCFSSLCDSVLSQWNSASSGTNLPLRDIYFVDSQTGYCVGGKNEEGIILKTSDSGESWEIVFCHDVFSFNYIVAVNDKLICFGNSGIAITYDDGITWFVDSFPYNPSLVQVSGSDTYFINGSNSSLSRFVNNSVNEIAQNVALYYVSGDTIVTWTGSMFDHYLLESIDSGVIWDTINLDAMGLISPSPTSGAALYSSGDLLLLIVTYPPAILYSYNRGKDWLGRQIKANSPYFVLDDQSIYSIIQHEGKYMIALTKNKGESWLEQDTSDNRINAMYFYDRNLGFAVGEQGTILRTTNAGGVSSADEVTAKSRIKLFPNPSKRVIHIVCDTEMVIDSIALFDMQSNLIGEFKGHTSEISVKNMSPGVYIVHVHTNKGFFSDKIVIPE